MSNIIPFDSKTLPAYLTTVDPNVNDELGSGSSYKVIHFKGKEWSIKEGGDSKPILKDGYPAPFIDVVIVRVWPLNKDNAKVYYAQKYTEGSDAKPTCYSNDGVKPSQYAQEPQSASCATCPHNQWGSRITDDGKKAKVCQDSKRIAVAVPGYLDDPMLLRVPATSLSALRDLGAFAKARRTSYFNLLTRIGFEQGVAYPKLTFTPLGYLDDASVTKVTALRESPLVEEICGITESAPPMDDDLPKVSAAEPFESPKEQKTEKKAQPKAESKAKAQLDELVADINSAPKAEAKTEVKAKAAKDADVIEVDDLGDLAENIAALLNDD